MKLFQPLQIKSLVLPNRWVMSPMCMYTAFEGVANDFHLVHYGTRAQGGVGLIMIEATGVEPRGRITTKCLGLWNEEQELAIKKITDFVHQQSTAKIGIQLAHAGRKASTWEGKQITVEQGAWQAVAPSAIAYQPGDKEPTALSIDEIKSIINHFRLSAQRAVRAGCDVVEIHAAHGYLIHQFLSPLSNIRHDEYGGSFENRIRFLIEIVDAVQQELKHSTPLFVRISATEYASDGWDIGDSIALSKVLKTHQVDLIDVSSGGNIHGARISLFTAYQVPYAAAIKDQATILTGAVGLIETAEVAESILQDNKADLIFMARALLRNPYLPAQSSFETKDYCFFPGQYVRAVPKKQGY